MPVSRRGMDASFLNTKQQMNPPLQTRDIEIGYRLTHCYRVTTAMIEANVYSVAEITMQKRLEILSERKWLQAKSVVCCEVSPIEEPLFGWQPGDSEPDYGAVSYQARSRWMNIPVVEQRIYTPTSKLLDYYGLPNRKPVLTHQVTHDLGCNCMYWYAAKTWPSLEFLGEDLFGPTRGYAEGVEDAQLVDGDEIVCVLEHAGKYRMDRVKKFHHHVAERGLPYFLF